jgi:hypothetical protein
MRSFTIPLALIATLGSTRLHAQAEDCGETMYPTPLPQPSALVDSAQAVASLGQLAVAKPVLFSLVFKPGDSLPQIRPLDKSDSAAAVTLRNFVRRQRPADFWAVRVRIAAGGNAPALTLEHSTYCPPVPRYPISNRPILVPTQSMPGDRIGRGLRTIVVHAEVLVAANGRVIRVRILEPSGSPRTDYEVSRDLRRQHFQPARLDGEPIEGLYRTGENSPRP